MGSLGGRSEVTIEAEGTGRTEAFSDGIFAIAMTLLVLEIRLPEAEGEGSLRSALLALWPSYVAFALSFFVLLVTWVNHHDLCRLLRTATRRFHVANGFVLFYVSFVPFPTAVLASHLAGSDIRAAVAFYCGTFILGSIAWILLLATIERDKLFFPDVDDRTVRDLRRSLRIGLLANVSATLLALVLPWFALVLNVVVRLNWLRLRFVRTERHP